jgi:cyclic pyranopterin phosphate synthase
MPRDVFGPEHGFLPRDQILSYEEIARLVRVFAELGVSKVRLTGGEPLLRRDLETLVSSIATTPGIDDIALTTNGSLLAGRAKALRDAGLGRVTVSLDSVDPLVFAAMGDTKIPLSQVLDGIAAAAAAGLAPVKLNAVIQRGVNDAGLLDLVDYARDHGHILRLIEFMDVGTSNDWRRDDVVPAAEIIDRIAAVHPLETAAPDRYGEVARRWTYSDGAGELGVITSVTQPFCTDCTRARLTATGELFTCLFASRGQDLRAVLRSDASDTELRDAVTAVWTRRTDRYSELRDRMTVATPARAEMSYLGG